MLCVQYIRAAVATQPMAGVAFMHCAPSLLFSVAETPATTHFAVCGAGALPMIGLDLSTVWPPGLRFAV